MCDIPQVLMPAVKTTMELKNQHLFFPKNYVSFLTGSAMMWRSKPFTTYSASVRYILHVRLTKIQADALVIA